MSNLAPSSRLHVGRGLFRLWLVVGALWLIGVGAIYEPPALSGQGEWVWYGCDDHQWLQYVRCLNRRLAINRVPLKLEQGVAGVQWTALTPLQRQFRQFWYGTDPMVSAPDAPPGTADLTKILHTLEMRYPDIVSYKLVPIANLSPQDASRFHDTWVEPLRAELTRVALMVLAVGLGVPLAVAGGGFLAIVAGRWVWAGFSGGHTALWLLLLLLSFCAEHANAQSLSGISIGDNIGAASRIGLPPVTTNQAGPFTVRKWRLPDQNELSITFARDTGKIVYMECDWGGQQSGTYADFPGFHYGRTSLSQIRQRFGSNGFTYGDRTAKKAPDGSIVMFNSYETQPSDVVVTFITKIQPAAVRQITNNPQAVGMVAHLDALVLGDPQYLRNIWGARLVFDPTYHKIDWH